MLRGQRFSIFWVLLLINSTAPSSVRAGLDFWSDSFSSESQMTQMFEVQNKQNYIIDKMLSEFSVEPRYLEDARLSVESSQRYLEQFLAQQERSSFFVVRGQAPLGQEIDLYAESSVDSVRKKMKALDHYLEHWHLLQYKQEEAGGARVFPHRQVIRKVENLNSGEYSGYQFAVGQSSNMTANQVYVNSLKDRQLSGIILHEMIREVVFETIRGVESGWIAPEVANAVMTSLKNRLRVFLSVPHDLYVRFNSDDKKQAHLIIEVLIFEEGKVLSIDLQAAAQSIPVFKRVNENESVTEFWKHSEFSTGEDCSKWLLIGLDSV